MSITTDIQSRFQVMVENYTPVNVIKYFDYVSTLEPRQVLEHSEFIFREPTKGVSVIRSIFESLILTPQEIDTQIQKIAAYQERKVTEGAIQPDHLNALTEMAQELLRTRAKWDRADYVRENTVDQLRCRQVKLIDQVYGDESDIVTEGLVKDLWKQQIDHDKSLTFKEGLMVILLGNLLNALSVSDMYTSNGDKKSLSEETGQMVSQLRKIVKTAKTTSDVKKVINAIRKTRKHLEMNADKLSKDTVSYHSEYQQKVRMNTIKQTIIHLKYLEEKAEKKLKSVVKEGIADMAPEIIYEDDEKLTCFDEEIESLMEEEVVVLEFAAQFVETFMTDSDEINMESFNRMMYTAYQYDALVEKMGPVRKAARKVALQGEKISRGVVHGIKKSADANKRVSAVAKRIPKHIDNLVNSTIGKLKDMDEAERRNKIIEGGFKVKIYRLIKNAALIGSLALIHPAIAGVGLITAIAVDKSMDVVVRRRILNELEDELKIVNEKVDDAKSDADKSKKYQLMRLKQKLENDIRRIQFSLSK